LDAVLSARLSWS